MAFMSLCSSSLRQVVIRPRTGEKNAIPICDWMQQDFKKVNGLKRILKRAQTLDGTEKVEDNISKDELDEFWNAASDFQNQQMNPACEIMARFFKTHPGCANNLPELVEALKIFESVIDFCKSCDVHDDFEQQIRLLNTILHLRSDLANCALGKFLVELFCHRCEDCDSTVQEVLSCLGYFVKWTELFDENFFNMLSKAGLPVFDIVIELFVKFTEVIELYQSRKDFMTLAWDLFHEPYSVESSVNFAIALKNVCKVEIRNLDDPFIRKYMRELYMRGNTLVQANLLKICALLTENQVDFLSDDYVAASILQSLRYYEDEDVRLEPALQALYHYMQLKPLQCQSVYFSGDSNIDSASLLITHALNGPFNIRIASSQLIIAIMIEFPGIYGRMFYDYDRKKVTSLTKFIGWILEANPGKMTRDCLEALMRSLNYGQTRSQSASRIKDSLCDAGLEIPLHSLFSSGDEQISAYCASILSFMAHSAP